MVDLVDQGDLPIWSCSLPPLPDELWNSIFLHTLPDRPSFSSSESPTLVTHVCRTWRRVAISYSLLWHRISLASSCDKLSQGTVELVRQWLERSKTCPLDVDLRLPFDVLPWYVATDDNESEVISEILNVLSKRAARIRTLLRGYSHILHKALQAESLPLLELFIVDPPGDEGRLCSFSLDTLPGNLKSLATFNTYIHFTPATVWPMLEHLEIWQHDNSFVGLSPRDCLDILSQLPTLRAAGFHIGVVDDEGRNDFPTNVVMPSLRCLVISTFPEYNIGLLFEKLSTPSLEALGLDGCAKRVITDHSPDFFRQCSRTLQLTALGQIGIIDVTLLGALTCAPSRSRVCICSSSFDGHVAARVGCSRRTERGIEYADRWTSVGCPGHLLSLAFTSEEMWSNLRKDDSTFAFPEWTYRDLDRWRPASVCQSEWPPEDTGSESIEVSICKGQSVSHMSCSAAWLS